MNLRNRSVPKITKDPTDQPSTSAQKQVDPRGKGELKEKTKNKTLDRKESEDKEVDKPMSTFNMENEKD